jgi:hypothetical protein
MVDNKSEVFMSLLLAVFLLDGKKRAPTIEVETVESTRLEVVEDDRSTLEILEGINERLEQFDRTVLFKQAMRPLPSLTEVVEADAAFEEAAAHGKKRAKKRRISPV